MSLSENIGSSNPEHMSRISDKEQVVRKLNFDSKNRIAFCVKLDRKKIVDEVKSSRQARRRGIRNSDILRTYERVVMQQIRKKIENFVISHKTSITNIIIQCDKDAEYFAKAGDLHHVRKGVAYRLSDYVAWCNNRDRDGDVQTIIQLDFTNEIPYRMRSILKLN